MDPRNTLKKMRRRLGRVAAGAARRIDPDDTPRPVRTWVRPGHFYSPVVDWEEVSTREPPLFDASPEDLPDVHLCPERQLEFLERFEPLRADRLYQAGDPRPVRYLSDNRMFGQKSANALHLMLRAVKPRRIVEVGSGFSSAVMLDTDEHFFESQTDLTFIEPYPDRLHGLLGPRDRDRCKIIVRPVQQAPRDIFGRLESGDVVFVDSSHVLKTGSDLCALLFEILPSLAAGVYVHFHDVMYPFEYPARWVEEGRSWNEAYALRAFLAYNPRFELQFWASYLYRCHRPALERVPEVCADGSSIWIRKIT